MSLIGGRVLHTINSLKQPVLVLQISGKIAKTLKNFYAVIKDQSLMERSTICSIKDKMVTVFGDINVDKKVFVISPKRSSWF